VFPQHRKLRDSVTTFWDGRDSAIIGSDGMDMLGRAVPSRDPVTDQEQKRVAFGYLQEAWAEARLDGVDGDCLAQASLFIALAEFVGTYGEEAAATYANGLAVRIRNGEFSLDRPCQ
jgi:hypothetical protein